MQLEDFELGGQQLHQRVQARDRLLNDAERLQRVVRDHLVPAFQRGELVRAETLTYEHREALQLLVNELSTYQAELHNQAEELRTAQSRAITQARRFQSLFDQLPLPALLLELTGEVMEQNHAADALLQSASHSAPCLLQRFFSADIYQLRVRPAVMEAQSNGGSVAMAVPLHDLLGRHHTADLHLRRLPDTDRMGWSSGRTGRQFLLVLVPYNPYHQPVTDTAEARHALLREQALRGLGLAAMQVDWAADRLWFSPEADWLLPAAHIEHGVAVGALSLLCEDTANSLRLQAAFDQARLLGALDCTITFRGMDGVVCDARLSAAPRVEQPDSAWTGLLHRQPPAPPAAG